MVNIERAAIVRVIRIIYIQDHAYIAITSSMRLIRSMSGNFGRTLRSSEYGLDGGTVLASLTGGTTAKRLSAVGLRRDGYNICLR